MFIPIEDPRQQEIIEKLQAACSHNFKEDIWGCEYSLLSSLFRLEQNKYKCTKCDKEITKSDYDKNHPPEDSPEKEFIVNLLEFLQQTKSSDLHSFNLSTFREAAFKGSGKEKKKQKSNCSFEFQGKVSGHYIIDHKGIRFFEFENDGVFQSIEIYKFYTKAIELEIGRIGDEYVSLKKPKREASSKPQKEKEDILNDFWK